MASGNRSPANKQMTEMIALLIRDAPDGTEFETSAIVKVLEDHYGTKQRILDNRRVAALIRSLPEVEYYQDRRFRKVSA